MFDIGWSELLLVAVITIIVVGPKDLPRALRTVGQWVAKVRAVAREFQNSVDDMIRESELDELRRETQSLATLEPDEPPRRIESPSEAAPIDPPADADEEAQADTYSVAGAMAPPHSLPTAEKQAAAEEPAAEPVSDAEQEPRPERTATRANG